MKSSISLIWMLPLCLIGLVACSRHEEPPAPSSVSQPAPAMVEPLRSATPSAAAPAIPEALAGAAGADLEKVAEQAAAFEDMVDTLRQPTADGNEVNTDPLDLESFIRGKSERELLNFAAAMQFKRPYAALQVLEYLFRHSPDPQFRMEVAILFGDTATLFGYLKDRALARECFNHLVDLRTDRDFFSALPRGQQQNLLYGMHRILVGLELDASAWMQMAAALRKCPLSDPDLSIADAFEAWALIHGNRSEDVSRIRALFEAIRARGSYAYAYATKETVDLFLAKSDDELADVQAHWAKAAADNRSFQERLRQVDHLPPAERLAELRRLNQEEVKP